MDKERLRSWLAMHPVVRLLVGRLVVAVVAALLGFLAALGLLPVEVAEAVRSAL